MDEREVKRLLIEKADELGSRARLARAIGHSPAYLSQMLGGERNISTKVLRFLRLRRVERFEPLPPRATTP